MTPMKHQEPRHEEPRFGGALRAGRLAANLTQEATASAIGVKQATVSAWESGAAYPTPGNMLRLAELYKLDERELLHLMVNERNTVPA